jgi:ABC-2 type transport system permease protein
LITPVKILKHSFWIAWKDILDTVRSKIGLVMLVLMPIFMMIMVGFVFPSMDSVSDAPVAIVNLDEGINNTYVSQVFLTNLEQINNETGMLDIHSADDQDDIRTLIEKGEIHGGLIIQADFSRALMDGRSANITIITDQSNPQLSVMVQTALSISLDQLSFMQASETLNQTYGIDRNVTSAIIDPYIIEVKGLVSDDDNYFQFVAPGVMGMVVMMSLMTGLPHAISYEKDMGTLDGMLSAPISRLSIILGKVFAQTARGMFQGIVILIVAVLVFDVHVYGNLILVFILLLLGVFSFVGLGILITSFADREETATMLMMSLMFPMMFLSGVFFPVEQMPTWVQYISKILPLSYSTAALRKVMILGSGIGSILPEIIFLTAFGVIFLIVAVPMFSRAMNK